MADTVVTLRPNGSAASAGWTIGGGAGSLHAATNDDSDSTYDDDGGAASQPLSLSIPSPTIPAGAIIHSVTLRVRLSRPSGPGTIGFWLLDPLYGFLPTDTVNATASIVTFTGTPRTMTADGRAWTAGDISRLVLSVNYGQGARVFEAYLDVAYNQKPAITVSAPTGVITTTTNPAVTWTYLDPEGNAQERYRVRVFNAAQYGAGGFDPETSSSVYDSGVRFGAVLTHTPPSSYVFANGAYRAYVKAADVGSGGRYSAWAYSGYTITVDPPAVPTIAAVADDTNATIDLLVQARDNRLTLNQADLETNTTGWANYANATLSRSTATFLHGAASLQMAAVAGGDMAARTPQGTSGIPVVVGETLTALASIDRGASTGHMCQLTIVFFDSGGTHVGGGDIVSAQVDTGSSSWPQMVATGSVPSTAAYAALDVTVLGASAGNVHFVDQIGLAGGSSTTWTRGGLFNPSLRVYVERSDDGGATWAAVPGSPKAVGVDEKAPMTDWAAPRGITLLYRAYTVGLDGSSYLGGGYSDIVSAFLPDDDDWLKNPFDPSMNMTICLEAPLDSDSTETQAVGEPVGGTTYRVARGDVRGEVFTLSLSFASDAEWEAFERLRKAQVTLLLQTRYGDGAGAAEQWYVALGPTRTVTRVEKGGGGQLRLVKIGAREVAAPAVP